MTHTPGPWKYHLGRGAKPRFHIQTEGGYQIASTTELTTRLTAKQAIDFEENHQREANARLIAAAPDLLAALEECVTDANCTAITTCDVAYMIRRFKAINEIARAAIAKAKGGA